MKIIKGSFASVNSKIAVLGGYITTCFFQVVI
jgi:hypothetical protein